MTTEELLAESVEAARQREEGAFQVLAPAGAGIVLFGAGALGRKVLAALRRATIQPLAFADNNPALRGRSVDNLPVFSLEDAIARWGTNALFVVTIFRPLGGEGVEARLRWLRQAGCQWTTSFLPLAWRHRGILPHFGAALPSQLLMHAAEMRRVAGFWGDEISREVFRQQLAWRLRGDFSGTSAPAPDQYFPRDLLRSRKDECFVDGGAYDGDTLRILGEGFSRAWAIEPDPLNAAKLRAYADKRITISEVALGRAPGRVRFNAGGTTASARSDSGGVEVMVATLDELLAGETPTFLKLDVEGDELAALQGGAGMLRQARPVVAVCLYHRPEDLWEIPLFLHEILPGHRFFLRIHEHDGFELVAYAIPPERCVRR